MKKHWNLKISPYKSGYFAELLCRLYMRLHGYRIIAKNQKCKTGRNTICGELDFIAIKNQTIVFCEVKKRQKTQDFLRALSVKQQWRIRNGAQFFLKTHKQYKKHTIRFDVFFIILPFKIKWIKNAF